ncbi:MAG: hypothetical protein L0I76_26185 [Pseudonocardia sp.]|nr:hypothetical protein [Pseudonocardia sp.]
MTTPPAGDDAARPPAWPASPRRDQMLSDLAAEIRAARDDQQRDAARLRADLARFEELLSENATLLGQSLPRITDLEGEVSGLTGRVEELSKASGKPAADKPPKITPADWPTISPGAAHREWDALGQWVAEVLCPIYQPTRVELPDCWPQHPRAVVELVWLRHAYVAAHEPDAAATASAEWHVRWRAAAFRNLEDAVPDKWCRPGEHLVDDMESMHRRDRAARARREADAQAAQQHPARRAAMAHTPPPAPADPHAPQTVENWISHWRAAMATDLQARRERHAAALAAATAEGQEPNDGDTEHD